ncbi:unnamed protein product [Orchesella dallaii]|uniref:Uncharacterized protein n=1 Tax=Orchesella dallaii TaxID=48710 RepID=A0ABP1QR35_9HEXA
MSSNDFPSDGLDDTFSRLDENTIENTTETIQKTNNKRKTSDIHGNPSHNKRQFSFTLTSVSEKLLEIDSSKSLTVFDVIDGYQSDPIAKEYADQLIELGFFPNIPITNEEILRIQEPTVKVNVSPACNQFVISTLMDFCRTNYFKNNMKDSTEAAKIVIPIKAKCMMPGFAYAPQEYLERDFNIIHSTGIQLQKNAYLKAKFISELLLVKSANRIFKEIEQQVKGLKSQQVTTQKILDVHFQKAQMEFVKKFNIKLFDWSCFTSKVKLILPNWRKENQVPPNILPNRFANEICERIATGKESFQPEAVKKEYLDFISNGKTTATPGTNSTPASSSSSSSSRLPTFRKNGQNISYQPRLGGQSDQISEGKRRHFTFKKRPQPPTNIPARNGNTNQHASHLRNTKLITPHNSERKSGSAQVLGDVTSMLGRTT